MVIYRSDKYIINIDNITYITTRNDGSMGISFVGGDYLILNGEELMLFEMFLDKVQKEMRLQSSAWVTLEN